MSKKLQFVALTLVFIVGLLTASSALASPAQVSTGIRGVSGHYVIHGVGGSTRITGRLVQRRRVRGAHGWKTVDVPLAGGVYLMISKPGAPLAGNWNLSGPWDRAGWTHTDNGSFAFRVSKPGYYLLVHVATKTTKRCENDSPWVTEDVLSIGSLGPVAATRDASGNLDVTLGIDYEAPAGLVSTATIGQTVLIVQDAARRPFYVTDPNNRFLFLHGVNTNVIPQLGLDADGIGDDVKRTGLRTYHLAVPAAKADEVFRFGAEFDMDTPLVVPVTKVMTFTPSAALQ